MSKMKDLYTEVCQLNLDGMAPADIAIQLNIPLDLVLGALEMERMSNTFKMT